ncbi:unnamed protein product [Acanthoscelides obtectus]|uniref:Uncharacterized protein n=1 Tax=Acanthoscelides obtectus TaxID=200917 RepID=A0A9P0MKI3_ACAOB|nr:unnamed protein product [Acanthoscelides obtectus]CAK1680799.1 52 kDa repressor of the inhibitor of the protein kinase [Acanthoscelides obtectus]
MGTINKIAVFFNTPKRLNVFKSHIDKVSTESKKEKLKKLCSTRWVERHDAILTFLELHEVTIAALSEIQLWRDKDSSSDAFSFLKSIQTLEFQFSLRIISKIFAITLPLSKQLQTTNFDLGQALDLAESVQNRLLSIRDNAEGEFNQIFKDVKTSCKEMDIEMALPRTNSRQTQRNNVPAEVPEEYFRRAYFIPFVDSSISHLKERLLKHKNIVQGFQVLLPNKHFNEDGLEKLYDFYEHFLGACSFETVLGE